MAIERRGRHTKPVGNVRNGDVGIGKQRFRRVKIVIGTSASGRKRNFKASVLSRKLRHSLGRALDFAVPMAISASKETGPSAKMNVIEGQRFGSWTTVRSDPTGKRILCRCECKTARVIALDELLAGGSTGCGCRLTKRARGAQLRPAPPDSAAALAAAEMSGARRRRWGGLNGNHVIVVDIKRNEFLVPTMVGYLDRRLGVQSPWVWPTAVVLGERLSPTEAPQAGAPVIPLAFASAASCAMRSRPSSVGPSASMALPLIHPCRTFGARTWGRPSPIQHASEATTKGIRSDAG